MNPTELLRRYADGERDFRGTNLRAANLCNVNLRGVNLCRVNLRSVYLSETNLRGANMRGVSLCWANLSGADLRGADLDGANLYETHLQGTNLQGADLSSTCLDPMTAPNAQVAGFEEIDGGWCLGYRTKNSPYMRANLYVVGEYREAPVFSTSGTECHPGIFVLPTIKEAWVWGNDIVSVIFRPWECHKAGSKWRVRWLIVWSDL